MDWTLKIIRNLHKFFKDLYGTPKNSWKLWTRLDLWISLLIWISIESKSRIYSIFSIDNAKLERNNEYPGFEPWTLVFETNCTILKFELVCKKLVLLSEAHEWFIFSQEIPDWSGSAVEQNRGISQLFHVSKIDHVWFWFYIILNPYGISFRFWKVFFLEDHFLFKFVWPWCEIKV